MLPSLPACVRGPQDLALLCDLFELDIGNDILELAVSEVPELLCINRVSSGCKNY